MKRVIVLVGILAIGSSVRTSAAQVQQAADAAATRTLQSQLAAADVLFNTAHWDEAIAVYRVVLAQAPTLTVALLRVGDACRYTHAYDEAIVAYTGVLKIDGENDEAKIGIAFANLEKGDLRSAEQSLTIAAAGRRPTREVFYNLAEVKLAAGRFDEAQKWYEKALALDPKWDKPIERLALIKRTAVRSAAPSGGR